MAVFEVSPLAAMAIFGDVCTYGILYSDGQVARSGDRPGGVQKAKSAKSYRNHRALRPLRIRVTPTNPISQIVSQSAQQESMMTAFYTPGQLETAYSLKSIVHFSDTLLISREAHKLYYCTKNSIK